MKQERDTKGEWPMSEDIRWKQRFSNYLKALQQLTYAVELAEKRELTDLEKQGLIQGFEFTHELAWKVLKDFLENQGISNLIGSKDAVRSAFKNGLIENGDVWMTMILDRNRTSHTYDLEISEEIAARILANYYPEFQKMAKRFNILQEEREEL
ncbi:MAG TPA: nucleotidyltransferase substrate binding protein [Desulfomicrobiaceae bacterium]|nr:nucleotidyltransferase substrate binding protein [Desulfomicrobiaceae bacterium]